MEPIRVEPLVLIALVAFALVAAAWVVFGALRYRRVSRDRAMSVSDVVEEAEREKDRDRSGR